MDTQDSLIEWLDKAMFLFQSENIHLAGKIIILYIAVLWISLIIWVTRDAIHRSSHILFQIGAVLLNIFLPLFGLVLYLILRPEKTLLEKYHEDLEYRMLEGGDDLCFSCATSVKEDFTFCYECGEKLKFNCSSCKKSISRRWKICPFCGEKQKVSNQTNTKKKKS